MSSRWLPLVAWNLRDHPLDDESRLLLRNATHGVWANNVRLLAASRPALDALAEHGLEFVLLKGAALQLTAYPSAGIRPLGDVDVLVKPEHISTARALLADHGWRPLRSLDGLPEQVQKGFDLRKAPDGALDVHRYLLPECRRADADDNAWVRTRVVHHDGRQTRVLAPADQLLHVCIHGLRWSPVHAATWLADAAYILRTEAGTFEWDVLVDEACDRRLRWQMRQALEVLARTTSIDIPGVVLRRLASQHVSLLDRAESYTKARLHIGPAAVFHVWCTWRRLRADSPEAIGFAAFLGGVVGAPRRRGLVRWAWNHFRRLLRRPAL